MNIQFCHRSQRPYHFQSHLVDQVLHLLKDDQLILVVRHVDAGYDIAIQTAKDKGIKIPMIDEAGDK
jgi:urocanate hydratase